MKIFFTASVRGGRSEQPHYASIIRVLEKHGTVLSRHVSSVVLSQYGETALSGPEVLEREMKALQESNMVVAEVSTPSLGVGYLVAQASMQGKRIIALYTGDPLLLSGIIKGDPRIELHIYETDDDIAEILSRALGNMSLAA